MMTSVNLKTLVPSNQVFIIPTRLGTEIRCDLKAQLFFVAGTNHQASEASGGEAADSSGG
jgi:hypothetical protein